jgi:hypothetical protein
MRDLPYLQRHVSILYYKFLLTLKAAQDFSQYFTLQLTNGQKIANFRTHEQPTFRHDFKMAALRALSALSTD